jgi:hypothetical protein
LYQQVHVHIDGGATGVDVCFTAKFNIGVGYCSASEDCFQAAAFDIRAASGAAGQDVFIAAAQDRGTVGSAAGPD